MSDQVASIIDRQYVSLQDETISDKNRFNIYSAIIQGKIMCADLLNYGQHITVDIKKFIHYDILASNSSRVEYDHLHTKDLLNYIETLPIKDQLDLLDFYVRILKKNFFDDQAKRIEKKKRLKLIRQALSMPITRKKVLTLVTLGPTYNFQALCASFILCVLLIYVFSLPSINPSLAFLKVSDYHFLDNFYLNRLLNTMSRFGGIDLPKSSVEPKNSLGLLLIICGKLLFYVVIGLNVLQKLEEYLKR